MIIYEFYLGLTKLWVNLSIITPIAAPKGTIPKINPIYTYLSISGPKL